MSILLNVDWSAVAAVLGSLAVVVWMLLLIAYVQLWRHRIHRIRRAVRGRASPRVMRAMQPEVQSEEHVQEYLENADFSNEGNPNFGWKERFLERSHSS